jgi:Zierdtviridae DNA helicase
VKAYLVETIKGPRIEVEFSEMGAGQGYFAAKQVSAGRRTRNGGAALEVARVGYPLSVDKCREMRDVWGEQLKVHKSLADWYRTAARLHRIQVGMAAQTDAKLTRVPALYPKLNGYLFGDQRVTAAWVSQAYRGGGLLGDEVGTGKTVGIIAGLIEAGVNGPTLVICPKISVKAVWGKEFREHCPDVPVYLCRGKRQHREAAIAAFLAEPKPFKVLVVVSEMLRIKARKVGGRVEEFWGYEYPDLFDITWACVVADESHKLLGSLDVVKGNLAGEGLKALRYTSDRLKLAVSATPFGKGGRIDALFGTLHWLWPDEFPGKWAWLGKYFDLVKEMVPQRGTWQKKEVTRIGGFREAGGEEKFWAELGPRVLRRTMEEVSPAHRGLKHFVTVACEMDTTQRVQYTKFTDDGELAMDGGILTTVGVLDYMTRSRQFANGVLRMEGGRVVYAGESCKLDRLMAHIEGLEPTRKLVITSQWNEYLDAVEARLDKAGEKYYRMDGSTTEAQRERMMEEFQSDRVFAGNPTIFLLNSQAGGVSITLDAADEMHQLDRMYPPEANTQLYGRIFRRGRAHKVLYYLYEAMGTIDEKITENTEAGAEAQRRLLDGRRGQEYIRQLAKYQEEM